MRRLGSLLAVLSLAVLAWAADLRRDLPNPAYHTRYFQKSRPASSTLGTLARDRAAVERQAALTGSAKLLVILVEFGGPDTFEFIPSGTNASTWDPIGKVDNDEWAGKVGDCSLVASRNNIAAPTRFTYSGPLHNEIPRPTSGTDFTGWRLWNENFNRQYYADLIFGNGIRYDYARQDGSRFISDLTGMSARNYYADMSGGRFNLTGEVVGWVKVPHSIWWYGADPCPGALSSPHGEATHNGGIPNAGTVRTLVRDAVDAVKLAYPSFDWSSFDVDHDGVVDHLWIITAGISESDTAAASHSPYGEGGIWPHAASVTPAHVVTQGLSVGRYLMVNEDSPVGTLVHEFAHDIGAIDLYSYGGGHPSPGLWSLMDESWVGYPSGGQPVSMDPMHLDAWGWLNPLVISNPAQEYTVRIGQTSPAPTAPEVYRGIKIQLPDGKVPLPVTPHGASQWWGGKQDLTNSMMTLAEPVTLPPGAATLSVQLAYQLEEEWDFLWVQLSADKGATWKTLTNAHTRCRHDNGWIGGDFGFPEDLCAAGIAGFTGQSATWPAFAEEQFDLSAFAGQPILLRFWYMTDWNLTRAGAFVDDLQIRTGTQIVLADGAEPGGAQWTFVGAWERNSGSMSYSHSYYLQWRNIAQGLDAGLANPGYAYAPANSGLLVWYLNERYTDNEIQQYLFDAPSFGPKGRMLLFDAHPEPYRDPVRSANGFANEGANIESRGLMRDAPFSRNPSTGFTLLSYRVIGLSKDETFEGRPAVPAFSDGLGYYPGAELVSPSPSAAAPRWITRQWDASAVTPSRIPTASALPGSAPAKNSCSTVPPTRRPLS